MNTTAPNDRIKSLTGTILFHATILALLMLMKCGGGGGGNGGLGYTGLMSMDVAGLGNPVDGWGDPQPEATSAPTPVKEVPADQDPTVTDDNAADDTPAVKPTKENPTPKPPKENTPKPKPTPETTTKPVQPEQPKIDNKLNDLLNNMGKGQGTTTGGGQQGSKDGQIDGKGVLGGGGSQGTGGGQGGGNGTGTGPGNGPGSGPGSGGGVSGYSLSGRTWVSKPTLNETAPDEGVVVVDIWVDSNGNVTKASVNVSRSSTTNSKLYDLAVSAARKAKFSASNQAEQKGTITINFVLK